MYRRHVFAKNLFLVILAYWFSINAYGVKSVQIKTGESEFRIGEPFIVDLIYEFAQPRLSIREGIIEQAIVVDGVILKVANVQSGIETDIPLMSVILKLCDEQGLRYEGAFLVFYDHLRRDFIFKEPGNFSISVLASETVSSNVLAIRIDEPFQFENDVLSILQNPNDVAFLLGGVYEKVDKIKRIAKLREVVDRGNDTILAKLAAARLGIEELKEIKAKYPRSERFMSDYRDGLVQEPLVEQSHAHLIKALELPDEFPIRQEVLSHLINIEILKGNNVGALFYANELSQKYPKGEIGGKVSVAKLQEEILRLEARLVELAQQRREKLEEIAKWLDELWLADEELQKTIDPNQWQQFIEALKEQTESKD